MSVKYKSKEERLFPGAYASGMILAINLRGRQKTMSVTRRTISLEAAKRGVRAYNHGLYHGVMNIDIDIKARAIFSAGLATTNDGILRQVRFIGKDYGGVAGQPGAIGLAPEITSDILHSREQYQKAASNSSPILLTSQTEIRLKFCIAHSSRTSTGAANGKCGDQNFGTS
jgi:hypothetical protein